MIKKCDHWKDGKCTLRECSCTGNRTELMWIESQKRFVELQV